MRRLLTVLLAVALLVTPLAGAPAAGAGSTSASSTAEPSLVALRVGSGRRSFGYRYRSPRQPTLRRPLRRNLRRSPHLLRRIVNALALGYVLHLLFSTPAGNALLLALAIGLTLLVLRLRRLRSYPY